MFGKINDKILSKLSQLLNLLKNARVIIPLVILFGLIVFLIPIVSNIKSNQSTQAEQVGSSPNNSATSTIRGLYNELVSLGHGSNTNSPNNGTYWNRIITSSKWSPDAVLSPSDVRAGKQFYGTGRVKRTGTMNLSNLKPENIRYGVNIAGVTGTMYAASDLSFNDITHFTSSGSWTVPSGTNKINVILIGGGGGGAKYTGPDPDYPSHCHHDATGNGGDGGTTSAIVDVSPGQTISFTVGRGGAEHNNGGSNGGTTSFLSHSAAGGEGGRPTAHGADAADNIDPNGYSLAMINTIISGTYLYGHDGLGGNGEFPSSANHTGGWCSWVSADDGHDGAIIIQ